MSRPSYLIASCDKYRDLWDPFFKMQARFWPNCPYRIYLGTDSAAYSFRGLQIEVLHSGTRASWSEQVADYLNQIPSDTILFSLEDFILRKDVDNELVLKAESWFVENPSAASLRLNALPKGDLSPKNAWISEYSLRTKYRISTQAAFWRKRAMLDLLEGPKSPWEFETKPNAVSVLQRHYCCRSAVLPYRGLFTHHVVEKGRWIPHELLRLRLGGIVTGRASRRMLSIPEYTVYMSRVLASRFLTAARRKLGGR